MRQLRAIVDRQYKLMTLKQTAAQSYLRQHSPLNKESEFTPPQELAFYVPQAPYEFINQFNFS